MKTLFISICSLFIILPVQANRISHIPLEQSIFSELAPKLGMYGWAFQIEGEYTERQITSLLGRQARQMSQLPDYPIKNSNDLSLFPSNMYFESLLALDYLNLPKKFSSENVSIVSDFSEKNNLHVFEALDSSPRGACSSIYLFSMERSEIGVFSTCYLK